MFVALFVGGVVLPYATLWASRNTRVRGWATHIDTAGRHRRFALVSVASSGALVGLGLGVPTFERWTALVAWVLTLVGLLVYAHVETFVAATKLRHYPSATALHFDLARPRTWLTTGLRICATWTWLLRTRHRTVGVSYLACTLVLGLGSLATPGVPTTWLLVGGADTLVLGLACLPVPVPGWSEAARLLGSQLE